jgi:hypothetical protein
VEALVGGQGLLVIVRKSCASSAYPFGFIASQLEARRRAKRPEDEAGSTELSSIELGNGLLQEAGKWRDKDEGMHLFYGPCRLAPEPAPPAPPWETVSMS